MEMIVFCGLQASGKTTFYVNNFLNTHVRISMDLLNTRNKEAKFLDLCLELQQRVVIDNTNKDAESRNLYTNKARQKKFRTLCYYFKSNVSKSIERNNNRVGKNKVEEVAIKSCFKGFEIPGPVEYFDEIWEIELQDDGTFHKQKLFHKINV